MPEPQAEAIPAAPIANQEVDVMAKLEEAFPSDAKQVIADEKLLAPEKVAEQKPEIKDGEETPTEDDGIEKVFIKGENGEQLEANLEDVIKDTLQLDNIKIVDGKAVIDLVANGKTHENVEIPKLIKWAQMGVNANQIIEKANRSIELAESAMADQKRMVNQEARQIASQEINRIIDSLTRGIHPDTGQVLSDDLKEGARLTADQLNQYKLDQRLRQLEQERNQDRTISTKRQIEERDKTLRSEAQAKMETVFQPFTQYFKADGKNLDGLQARFKQSVVAEVSRKTNEYRQEIGPEPDISADWVRDTAKSVAKEIFKDFYPLLNKPTPKPVSKPTKATVATGKVPVQQGPRRALSWDEEREQIERELGFKK